MNWLRNLFDATQTAAEFEVSDDSGFLAIIDPDAYRGFVHADWTLQMLQEHLKREVQSRHLLIWGTGLEHMWRIGVSFRPATATGFREVTGSIESSKGRLLLTNYESLTMAAQFPDTSLPQRHEQEQLLQLPPALYNCRIIQLSNPETSRPFKEKLNFLYEITHTTKPTEPWSEVPWKAA
jgi:hypothetical protein